MRLRPQCFGDRPRRPSRVGPFALSAVVAATVGVATLSVGAAAGAASSTTTTTAKATTTTAKATTTTAKSTRNNSARTFLSFNCAKKSKALGRVTAVPMAVTRGRSGQVLRVGVCVGKHGPYPFVVASGVTQSVIDPSLASALHLKKATPASAQLGGYGCTVTSPFVKAPAMHLKGVALAPQAMAAVKIRSWDGQRADGVIGSDVLGRFGAVRLDFTAGKLTVPGPEGPPPLGHQLILGQPTATPPKSLLHGSTPPVIVPLSVVVAPGSIAPYAKVSIGTPGPYAFVLDSGSPHSSIAASLIKVLKLQTSTKMVAPVGVGCSQRVPIVSGASMSLGSTSLTVTLPRSANFSGPQRAGIQGALGLDALGSYSSIVVDYRDAKLALGTG